MSSTEIKTIKNSPVTTFAQISPGDIFYEVDRGVYWKMKTDNSTSNSPWAPACSYIELATGVLSTLSGGTKVVKAKSVKMIIEEP